MKTEINTVAQFKAAFFENLEFYIKANDKIRHDLASFNQHIDDYAEGIRDICTQESVPAQRTRKAWFAEVKAEADAIS